MKKFHPPKPMMVHFYTTITSSILTSSITIWYTAATAKDKDRLQRIIHCAEKVIGCNLSSLQDLHTSRTLRRAGKIMADTSHPRHKLSNAPLRQEAEVCQDQNLTPQVQFLPVCSCLINKA